MNVEICHPQDSSLGQTFINAALPDIINNFVCLLKLSPNCLLSEIRPKLVQNPSEIDRNHFLSSETPLEAVFGWL